MFWDYLIFFGFIWIHWIVLSFCFFSGIFRICLGCGLRFDQVLVLVLVLVKGLGLRFWICCHCWVGTGYWVGGDGLHWVYGLAFG